ncbi:hypothetical protein JTB14_036252 [Gonioctena quinquepunctata]|nr:hypothetical protein JTB14_036252 [Gonioctena quinquepunctata]
MQKYLAAVFFICLHHGCSYGLEDDLLGLPVIDFDETQFDGLFWNENNVWQEKYQEQEENQIIRHLCEKYDLTLEDHLINCENIKITPKSKKAEIKKRDVGEVLEEGSGDGNSENPPDENKSESPAPLVDANAPEVDAKVPEVEPEAPVIDGEAPAVDAEAPVVDGEAPVNVDAKVPEVEAEAPVVDGEAPAVDAEAPVVNAPEVDAEAPVTDAKVAEVEAEAPVVDGDAPAVDAIAPEVDAEAPVNVDTKVAEVEAEAPVVDGDAPAVDAIAPEVNAEAPVNVDTKVPEVDAEAPVGGAEAHVGTADTQVILVESKTTESVESASAKPKGLGSPPVKPADLVPVESASASSPVDESKSAVSNKEQEKKCPENDNCSESDKERTDTKNIASNDKEGKRTKEEINDNQSGNAIVNLDDDMENTEKKLSKARTNENLKSASIGGVGESTEANDGRKDNKILITLFVAVLAVGIAAFSYNYIKRRKRNSAAARTENGVVQSDPEEGKEMKPLMKTSEEKTELEYKDEK